MFVEVFEDPECARYFDARELAVSAVLRARGQRVERPGLRHPRVHAELAELRARGERPQRAGLSPHRQLPEHAELRPNWVRAAQMLTDCR